MASTNDESTRLINQKSKDATKGAEPKFSRSGSWTSTSLGRGTMTSAVVAQTDTEGKDPPNLWSVGRKKLTILAALFISDIFCFMCLSIMAPFFPKEAELKGMSTTVSGWVFGTFSLVQFFFAPVVGRLIPKVGPRFTIIAGSFFGGSCTVLFGFLSKVPTTPEDNTVFTIFCFLLRIFLALGCSATFTSTFAIATSNFPENASTALGFLETAIGIGLVTGPALGGFLFEAGGFVLPFIVVGALMVMGIPVYYFLIPYTVADDKKAEEKGPLLAILRVPVIVLIFIMITVNALIWVSLDPTLEPHLRVYNLSPSLIGLVFLLLSGTYAITSPITGHLADRMKNSTPLMILGFVLSTMGLLLLGPSPILGFKNYRAIWLDLVSLVLIGIGSSLILLPTYGKIFSFAEKAGIPNSIGVQGAIAGAWTSSYALGEFLGPVMSGAITDSIGFAWNETIIAGVSAVMFAMTLFIYIYEKEKLCFKKSSPPNSTLP